MAKEVTGPGRWRPDQLETLRAADADRQQVADLLKASVDEGRLTLHEYDERIAATYWVAGPPGAALLAVTIGVQSIRAQQRRR